MLYRKKSIRDEYQEMVETELAKNEAEVKKLAGLAAKEIKAKKKVGALKTKKNK